MPLNTLLTTLLLAGVHTPPDPPTWSRFRGPNGSGIAEVGTLPARLSKEENLLFQVPVPPGHSSPVLFGEHLYLTAEDDGALVTLALDRETGATLWRRVAPRPRHTKVDERNHPASPTPVADERAVIVFFQEFGLLAYDHDGEERWRHPLGPFDNVYGMGASPIRVADLVVLACDQNRGSFLIALDANDGTLRWRAERPWARSGHCTPIVRTRDDGREEILLPGSFSLDAYDVTTGERTWSQEGLSFEMKSVPVLHAGRCYINGYGSPLNQPGNQVEIPPWQKALETLDADSSERIEEPEMPRDRTQGWFAFVDLDHDGSLDRDEWGYLQRALASMNGMLCIQPGEGDREPSLIWAHRRAVPQLPSPLVYGDVLYMLHDQGGLITTLSPQDGSVRERGRLRDARDDYYASPVAGDGKVYLVSLGGIVTVLPNGGSLEPLHVLHLDEPCYGTPALAPRTVYLRSSLHLFAFRSAGA